MTEQISPEEVLQIMLKRDRFSAWLGLQIIEIRKGYCKLQYRITLEMMNGFDNVHGGVLFSAADSAFAFACNSYGHLTVALDASVSFTKPAKTGELMTVEAIEVFLGNKIGIYDVRTTNENNELIALFKGTAYRTSTKIS
ncbi:MAG TPA: hydroxyphenylacetyl-CoA thioesterase PaaI [Puia sp.]|jgi:acyl-CoA thioesterase|nr:hydroxyphenylacetyl-CoA thioesterase PaaI [Puia sp.]HZZ75359.1 hydroxyphenylacetyl-CoA thioesterase PaaI [Puia sp.]